MTKSPTRGGCYQRHVLLLFCGGDDRSHGEQKRYFTWTVLLLLPEYLQTFLVIISKGWMVGWTQEFLMTIILWWKSISNKCRTIGSEWTTWLWFFFLLVTKCIAGADRHRIKISVVVAARSHRTAIKQQKPQKKKKPPSVVGQTWSNDWNLIDTMTIAITWEMKMVIIGKGGDSSGSSNNIIERQRKIN